jgi:hypothetical protein
MKLQPKEIKFSGIISRIHNGIVYDGNSFMLIDDKKVIFNSDSRGAKRENREWVVGRLIGFKNTDFPYSGGDEELKTEYAGKKAEVFALKSSYDAFDNNGKSVKMTEYTIIGSSDYYIKLI